MANYGIKSHELPSELKAINSSHVSMECVLGRGSFGVVMKARWIPKNRDVAAKVIQTKNTSIVIQEIRVMHRLRHPNIIQVFGYGTMSNGDLFFLMEFMEGGSLDKAIHETKPANTQETLNNWSLQLIKGLAYIHENSHIHRDLKPLNILLSNQQKTLKIGDFGTARDELNQMTKGIGTPIYMAPEVFGTSNYTSKCDVYSFGITLCEMYTRRRPYEEMWDDAMLMVKIRRGLRPAIGNDVPERIKSTVKHCWNSDSNLRPTLSSIIASWSYEVNPRKVSDNLKPTDNPRKVSDNSKPTDNPRKVSDNLKPTDNPRKVSDNLKPTDNPRKVSDNSKPTDNPRKVSDNSKPTDNRPIVIEDMKVVDDLKVAKDVTKAEGERVNACIRLAYIWRENINRDQMTLISNIIIYSNRLLNSSTIDEISSLYAKRLHLIDAIIIDYKKRRIDAWWLSLYVGIIYDCFYYHSSKFDSTKCTAFDRQVRYRICQLIIEKIRFVLSDSVWTRTDWSTQDDRGFILYHFMHLIGEYRIETNVDDVRLLKKRSEQMNEIAPNNSYTKEIMVRIRQIEQSRHSPPAMLNRRRRSSSFRL